MTKYVIFTTIKNDGVGDFVHFEDIIQAINNNKLFADIELLLVLDFQLHIQSNKSNSIIYANLETRLKALGHEYIFFDTKNHTQFIEDNSKSKIYEIFAECRQAILISYDMIFRHYEPYLPKDIIVKFIQEHDGGLNKESRITTINNKTQISRDIHIRGMGLSSKYGVKVKNIALQSQAQALQTIQENDPQFMQSLLTATGNSNAESMLQSNIIIPAYFSYQYAFAYFLTALTDNPSFIGGKNIIVYQSGSNIIDVDPMNISYFIDILREVEANSLHFFTPDNSEFYRLQCSGKGSINIKVFTGFHISSPSYQALYHLAPLVGVSGDNSFELAIATQKLPFYWSKNALFKHGSYAGLIDIVSDNKLKISAQARDSFKKFFKLSQETIEHIEEYKDLDLITMISEWPVVAEYIKQHHNYFDNLVRIICEKLPVESLPKAIQIARQPKSWLSLFGVPDTCHVEEAQDCITCAII